MVMSREKRELKPTNIALIRRLKTAMFEKGLSTYELADAIGYSHSTVWRMITTIMPIDSLDVICKIAVALDIPLSEMLRLAMEGILGERLTIVINSSKYEKNNFKKEQVIEGISGLIMDSKLTDTDLENIFQWVAAYIKYQER